MLLCVMNNDHPLSNHRMFVTDDSNFQSIEQDDRVPPFCTNSSPDANAPCDLHPPYDFALMAQLATHYLQYGPTFPCKPKRPRGCSRVGWQLPQVEQPSTRPLMWNQNPHMLEPTPLGPEGSIQVVDPSKLGYAALSSMPHSSSLRECLQTSVAVPS